MLNLKYLALIGSIGFTGIAIKVLNTPYQYTRFIDWYIGKNNIQIENSIQALGNGGLWGVGIGR